MGTTELTSPSPIRTKDFDIKHLLFYCAHSIMKVFFFLYLIGRLWHEWAVFSQPLIFFKVSSVPLQSCHICHLQPPTGEALFRTDIGTFGRSCQYCSESVLVCSISVFVILIRAINSSRNIQPEPAVAVPTQNWMATNAQCGCHINICIYIEFKHLAHVPQQHRAREERGV